MTERTPILLPFPGFENTWYDTMIDTALDTMTESLPAGVDGDGEERDYGSELFDACDFQAVFQGLAREYVEEADISIKENAGVDLGLRFANLDMPSEYNYRNDRIFGTIENSRIPALFDRSASEGHKRLRALVRRECSDGDGYFSYYNPDLDEWLGKPVAEWDWFETTLLVRAALGMMGLPWGRIENDVRTAFTNSDAVYNAVERAIDWQEFEGRDEDDGESGGDAAAAVPH